MMSKAYEERFSAAIGEIFEEDKDLMKKLYTCMGKENLSYERDALFKELIDLMQEMRKEIHELSANNEKQQEKLNSLEGKNLNTLIVEQVKDIADSTKEECDLLKENFKNTKERIVSYVKDTLNTYYQKGKAGLLAGASSLVSGLRSMNEKKFVNINDRINKRTARIERLDKIQKELNATKRQVGNLFRTIFGREKGQDKESASILLTYMRKDLEQLNESDLKQAEHLLHSNKRLERLKETFDSSRFQAKKKASLDDQVRSAKKEQKEMQDKQKQLSYQKTNKNKDTDRMRHAGRT